MNKIYWVVSFALVFLLFSFQEPKLKKRITDTSFRYEFYVSDKEPSIKSERMYYWFKGGAIHNSENGISGELLNNTFEKFYLSNQLAEKGDFESGLKVGLWRTWYPNGVIETTQGWRRGRKVGMHFHYNENAVLIEKGSYYAGKKQGQWINYTLKDTATYNDGEIKVISEKEIAREAKKKENKVKRKVKREEHKAKSKLKRAEDKKTKQIEKDKSPINGVKPQSGKEIKKTNSKINASDKKPNSKAKKGNFFQRLFSKKEKPNGKST